MYNDFLIIIQVFFLNLKTVNNLSIYSFISGNELKERYYTTRLVVYRNNIFQFHQKSSV